MTFVDQFNYVGYDVRLEGMTWVAYDGDTEVARFTLDGGVTSPRLSDFLDRLDALRLAGPEVAK